MIMDNENLYEKYQHEAHDRNWGNGVPYMYGYNVHQLDIDAADFFGYRNYHATKYGYTRQPVMNRLQQWQDEHYHGKYQLHKYDKLIRPCFFYDDIHDRMVFLFDETYHRIFDMHHIPRTINQYDDNKNNKGVYISQEFYDVSSDEAFAFINKVKPSDDELASWNQEKWEQHSSEIMDKADELIHEAYYANYDNPSLLDSKYIIKFMPYGSETKLAFEKHYKPVNDFKPRSYQQEAVDKAFRIITENYMNGKPPVNVVLWAPTRSGKSFMLSMLFEKLRKWWENASIFAHMNDNHNHSQANFAMSTAIPAVFIELREAIEANRMIAYDDGMRTYRHHTDETGKMDDNCTTYKQSDDKMTCSCPCNFDCITSKGLIESLMSDSNAINNAYMRNARGVILQCSVQDYMGSADTDEIGMRLPGKKKHLQLNDNEFLLRVMDEVQLGGSEKAVRYNAAWNENITDEQYADNDVFNGIHPILGSVLVSATPYPVLHSAQIDNVVMITPSEIAADADDWIDRHVVFTDDSRTHVKPGSMKPWQSPYYGMPTRIITGMNIASIMNGISKIDDMVAVETYKFNTKNHNKGEIKLDSKTKQPMLTDNANMTLTGFIHGLFNVNGFNDDFMSHKVASLLSGYDNPSGGARTPGFTVLISVSRIASAIAVANRLRELLGAGSDYEKQYGFNYDVQCMYSIDENTCNVNSMDVETMKTIIRRNDANNQRSIILTVDKMMTGSTIPEITSLIMMRSGKSAIVREQAYGRVSSPFIRIMPADVSNYRNHDDMITDVYTEIKPVNDSGNSNENNVFVHANMKPCVLIIDLDPSEMIASLYNQQIAIRNIHGRTNADDGNIATDENPFEHVLMADGSQLTELQPDDIRNEYMKTHADITVDSAVSSVRMMNEFIEPVNDSDYDELVRLGSELKISGERIKASMLSMETCAVMGCDNKVVPGSKYCVNHADFNDDMNDVSKRVNKASNANDSESENENDDAVLNTREAAKLAIMRTLNAVIMYNILTDRHGSTVNECINDYTESLNDAHDKYHNVSMNALGTDLEMLRITDRMTGIIYDSGSLSCALDAVYARRDALMETYGSEYSYDDNLARMRTMIELIGAGNEYVSNDDVITPVNASYVITECIDTDMLTQIILSNDRIVNIASKNGSELLALIHRIHDVIYDDSNISFNADNRDSYYQNAMRNIYVIPTDSYTDTIIHAVIDDNDYMNENQIIDYHVKSGLSLNDLMILIRRNKFSDDTVRLLFNMMITHNITQDDFNNLFER